MRILALLLVLTGIATANATPIIAASEIDSAWTISQQSFQSGIGFVNYSRVDDRKYPLINVKIREFPSIDEAKKFISLKFPRDQFSSYAAATPGIQDSFDYLELKKREIRSGKYIFSFSQSGPDTFDDRKAFIEAYVKAFKE